MYNVTNIKPNIKNGHYYGENLELIKEIVSAITLISLREIYLNLLQKKLSFGTEKQLKLIGSNVV